MAGPTAEVVRGVVCKALDGSQWLRVEDQLFLPLQADQSCSPSRRSGHEILGLVAECSCGVLVYIWEFIGSDVM